MAKKKKERRQQKTTKMIIVFSQLYPYDKNTGEDIEPYQLDEKFTERIARRIGDILATDPDIGFDQENFDATTKIKYG